MATGKKAYDSKWYTQEGSTSALLSGVGAFIASHTLCQLAIFPKTPLSVNTVRHTVYGFKLLPGRLYRDNSQSYSCPTTCTRIRYHSPNDLVVTVVRKSIIS